MAKDKSSFKSSQVNSVRLNGTENYLLLCCCHNRYLCICEVRD
jgi:hypothetical protein